MVLSAFLLTAQMFSTTQAGIPQIVQAPIKEIFVPTGFDENDAPEFIVEGVFPNECYELKGYRLIRHEIKDPGLEKIWFTFWVEAYETLPSDCAEEKREKKDIPYIEVIYLPQLKANKHPYEIWSAQNRETPAGLLSIEKAPASETDSFSYAQVKKARLEKDSLKEGDFLLTLEGKFPSNCYDIDLEQTKFINKTTRIIEVLPVIKKFRDDSSCEDNKPVEFGRILPVSTKLKEKAYLFHIRIADGQALNLRVDMRDLTKQLIHEKHGSPDVLSAP